VKKCPCQSNKSYYKCCGVYISGKEFAPTPETLMRSRYCAYTKAKINYIAETMCGPAAENFNPVEAENWARSVKWVGLKLIDTSQLTSNDTVGFVEFAAYYKSSGKLHTLHERSEFHLINNHWYYVQGSNATSKSPNQTILK